MIPDETVDRVREAADIVQVIGEYVTLKRVGTDWRGPCPFHQGTHRNFSVSPKKRMYYCFVCHEGGDVFNFLQKRLGMEWPAAVKLVGEKSGIEVREVDSRRNEADTREPFWEVNAAAAEYFQRMLLDETAGKTAREYLDSRRIDASTIERFGLGYAPREIGLMRAHLNTLGFDDARLVEAGLMVQGEEESEPRPRFRGRLVFPIQDVSGRHVGFGGRLLGPGEPKYLNSPESPVFSKGRLLYNLGAARNAIRRDERAIVVEGYFDVVRLVAAGIEAVVAPLGTAMTEAQAALIVRYAKNVFLLYDSDTAGLKATFRAGDELLRQGASVQVVTLPDGDDPDSFVDRNGAAGLETELAAAMDIFERKIQILDRGGWFADLRRKRRAIDRLLPSLRATRDPLTRDLYIARASEALGMSRELLDREVAQGEARAAEEAEREVPDASARDEAWRDGPPPDDAPPPWVRQRGGAFPEDPPARGGRRGPRRAPPPPPPADRRPIRAPSTPRGVATERELVRAMLHARSQVEVIASRVGIESFRDPRYRAIFSALRDLGADCGVEELAEALELDAVTEMQQLLEHPEAVVDARQTVEDGLAALRERELFEELAAIDEQLAVAGAEVQDSLIARKKILQAERSALGGRQWKSTRYRKPR